MFVQANNVYPQLLLGRLLFSIGGAAVSTMVTAVLPVVTGRNREQEFHASLAEEATAAQHGDLQQASTTDAPATRNTYAPSSRLAGFVGACAGCGALISLVIFLPLPARLQEWGLSPAQSIQYSYYLVGAVALLVSISCLIGLRNLPGEEGKTWSALWSSGGSSEASLHRPSCAVGGNSRFPYLDQLGAAVVLGFRHRDIFIGYLGGFVARASSVGISLFIPLFVNHYYRSSGLCDEEGSTPGEIKTSCREAYVLASILTGVSQLVALIAAPAFGYLSDRSRHYHLPLLFACLCGTVGYVAFGMMPSPQFKGPDGTPGVFVVMALVGISQIGAIVCSLAVLSNGILSMDTNEDIPKHIDGPDIPGNTEAGLRQPRPAGTDGEANEEQPLLSKSSTHNTRQLSQLKGSIAGVYSLYGGAGILILTKLGGLLFDVVSSGAPFYIMAGFNGTLLLAGIIGGLVSRSRKYISLE